VLDVVADKQAVAAAVARWKAEELETAIVENKGCAATMRSLVQSTTFAGEHCYRPGHEADRTSCDVKDCAWAQPIKRTTTWQPDPPKCGYEPGRRYLHNLVRPGRAVGYQPVDGERFGPRVKQGGLGAG